MNEVNNQGQNTQYTAPNAYTAQPTGAQPTYNTAAQSQQAYTAQPSQQTYSAQQPSQQAYTAQSQYTASQQPNYGAGQQQYNQYSAQPQYTAQQYAQPVVDQDSEDNKFLAALTYFGIIFMILALVANGKSKHVRFHANQALVLDVVYVIGALLAIIPVLGWIVVGILSLLVFIFRIMGIVKAVKCRQEELPLFGKYVIIPKSSSI